MPHGPLFRSSRALHSSTRGRLWRGVAGVAEHVLTAVRTGAAQGSTANRPGAQGLKKGEPQTQDGCQGLDAIKKFAYAVTALVLCLLFAIVIVFLLRSMREASTAECRCIVNSSEPATYSSVRNR